MDQEELTRREQEADKLITELRKQALREFDAICKQTGRFGTTVQREFFALGYTTGFSSAVRAKKPKSLIKPGEF